MEGTIPSTTGSQSAIDLFLLSEPESPPLRPRLERRNTLASLGKTINKDQQLELEEHAQRLEMLYSITKSRKDVDIDRNGDPISPHFRRKKSRREGLNKAIKALEKMPQSRTGSFEKKINLTIEQLKEYDDIDVQMLHRLEKVAEAEICQTLEQAIADALISYDVTPLLNFDDNVWTRELVRKLILDGDGQLHLYAYYFTKTLFDVWVREETADTCFRSDGPLPYFLEVWLSTDDFNFSLVDGTPMSRAKRLTRRILMHIPKYPPEIVSLLIHVNYLLHDIGASTGTLITILFLRYYVPSFYKKGVDPQVAKFMIEFIGEDTSLEFSGRSNVLYGKCIDFIDEQTRLNYML